jgi:hypothetical protein
VRLSKFVGKTVRNGGVGVSKSSYGLSLMVQVGERRMLWFPGNPVALAIPRYLPVLDWVWE